MNDITSSSRWDFLERPRVEAIDQMLGVPKPVLDHGFVRVVDYMGNDPAIVQAARVSYGKGTKAASDDRGLIRYLMRHWHTTPLEMCEIKLHVKLPVFVARQWIRHRTANVNEVSARYSILAKEFYIPEPNDISMQSKTNKQGREQGGLSEATLSDAVRCIQGNSNNAYHAYEFLLNEDGDEPGVARELSRMTLPTNIYTEWYWKTDLHNLFHFLTLRADSHAQMEIRRYAEVISGIVKLWTPLAFEAWMDYRYKAENFSRQELDIVREIVREFYNAGYDPENILADHDLGKTERADFIKKIGLSR